MILYLLFISEVTGWLPRWMGCTEPLVVITAAQALESFTACPPLTHRSLSDSQNNRLTKNQGSWEGFSFRRGIPPPFYAIKTKKVGCSLKSPLWYILQCLIMTFITICLWLREIMPYFQRQLNPKVLLNNASGLGKNSMDSGYVWFVKELFPRLDSRSLVLCH